MTFNAKLTELLKTHKPFVSDDGELLIDAVQGAAWKTDHDLVKLLLSDNEIKGTFFEEIGGHWIFNVNKFIDYISRKNFLDNSYTRFRNLIGLTIGDKYLRERGDVVLAWAYKDTALEGGQTKEEEQREEIFFNEVLADDEINRLLDPKVLTGFRGRAQLGVVPAGGSSAERVGRDRRARRGCYGIVSRVNLTNVFHICSGFSQSSNALRASDDSNVRTNPASKRK
jgi:adenine-specific DNA-methyltransferase